MREIEAKARAYALEVRAIVLEENPGVDKENFQLNFWGEWTSYTQTVREEAKTGNRLSSADILAIHQILLKVGTDVLILDPGDDPT